MIDESVVCKMIDDTVNNNREYRALFYDNSYNVYVGMKQDIIGAVGPTPPESELWKAIYDVHTHPVNADWARLDTQISTQDYNVFRNQNVSPNLKEGCIAYRYKGDWLKCISRDNASKYYPYPEGYTGPIEQSAFDSLDRLTNVTKLYCEKNRMVKR